jgi:hypothetical protein
MVRVPKTLGVLACPITALDRLFLDVALSCSPMAKLRSRRSRKRAWFVIPTRSGLAAPMPQCAALSGDMKRYVIAFLLFLVLMIAYWASPFVSLHRLAAGLAARNDTAIADKVAFARLRNSLSNQILTAYLRLTGRINSIVGFIGPDLVGLAIAQLLTPENMAQLLEGGTISTEIGPVSFDFGELPVGNLDAIWRGWLGTEYWMDEFSISVPVSAPESEQFHLRMRLTQWRWRVVGIDLPEQLLLQIAQKLADKYP